MTTTDTIRQTPIASTLFALAEQGRIELRPEQVETQLSRLEKSPPMKRYIRDRWVAALRSGHFDQTKAALHVLDPAIRTPGYCCLGVLADLDTKVKEKVDGGRGHFYFPASDPEDPTTETGSIPGEYAEDRYGLTHDAMNALIEFNDSGATFDHIADLIETYL